MINFLYKKEIKKSTIFKLFYLYLTFAQGKKIKKK